MLKSKYNDLDILGAIRQELITVCIDVDLSVFTLGLEKSITPFCNESINAVLTPFHYFKQLDRVSALTEEVPLSVWAEHSQYDVPPNEPEAIWLHSWLKIPEEFHPIKIKCYKKGLNWSTTIKLLAWWVAMSQGQFVEAEWTTDISYIMLTIGGIGGFNTIHRTKIEIPNSDFWILDVESKTRWPAESLASALTIAQLGAKLGGGTLTVREFNKQQVEFQLNIPKANANTVGFVEWHFPNQVVIDGMTSHILKLIMLGFEDVSQKLIDALSEELSRVESSARKEKSNEDYQMGLETLRNTISRLDQIIQRISNWQKDHRVS